MKPTATLVNIARGGSVDDAALAEALRTRRIAAAGLDVFEGEPDVRADLRSLPNIVMTPHLGGGTLESLDAMANRVVENMDAFFAGKPLVNEVRSA
jgi:gluconate 2-dehydrogenase